MNGVLIIIVFAGICSAVPKYQVPVPIPLMPDLKIMKLKGEWHPIAVVQYDGQQREDAFGYVMEPRNGELFLKVDVPRNRDCRRKRVVVHRVRLSKFDPDDQKATVTIVDTDYDNYLIIHFLLERMGSLQLYGREQTVSDEVKEKFRTYAQDLQFDPNAISYVTESELCK